MKNKNKNNDVITLNINRKVFMGVIIAIILLGGILLVRGCAKRNDSAYNIKSSYSDGRLIVFDSFSKNFTSGRTITVKNKSNKTMTYSLEWEGVSNTLKKQNAFLYELVCDEEDCAHLGKSQVPVTDFSINDKVTIGAHKTHKYKVIFTYKGSEKDAKFIGELIVKPSNK